MKLLSQEDYKAYEERKKQLGLEHDYYPGKATWKDYLLIAAVVLIFIGLLFILADVVFGAEAIAGVIN